MLVLRKNLARVLNEVSRVLALKRGSEKLVSRDYKASSLLFLQALLDDIFNFTGNGYALIFLRYDASLSIALPRHGNPQIFHIKDQLPVPIPFISRTEPPFPILFSLFPPNNINTIIVESCITFDNNSFIF